MTIYFVRWGENGPIKIGYTADLSSRMAHLQNANWQTVYLIRQLDGELWQEKWIHRHYREDRIRGEWFRFSETMMTIVPPATPPDLIRRESPSGFVPSSVSHLLDTISSMSDVARALGVPSDRVRKWRMRGQIPVKYWLELTEWSAAERGGTITLEGLSLAHHRPPGRRVIAPAAAPDQSGR